MGDQDGREDLVDDFVGTVTIIRFDWRDRLRVLLGFAVAVRVRTEVRHGGRFVVGPSSGETQVYRWRRGGVVGMTAP